ncbi:N-acetylneuraminate synthase family protein [Clostridium tyrobutyricum]|uniref:N-acetylneuraminate synthase family protein n=1 Tax=Clostridium tyrobutyricum TaxID=1519 RepID=UPI001C38D965|nr:N-acetylneuraminate synthase family protein [Clostridium tyrobutyricum]MBV4428318.1 N-acetylneuraminate synthase family protein [Clostridium tyrobutyricum]MBV4443308.1 N-acetylneuraminate synthase family protein [Clostridium tyrobutyricum]
MYKKSRVIAEVGCNHMGNFEIAKEFIKMASVFCKVDAVKFQKRNPRECLTKEQYNAPHPNPVNSYGKTYGEHREFLEFSLEQHRELKNFCEEMGVEYSTSVWDLTSAKEIVSLNPKLIKIPSACNNHYTMLDWLCNNYNGEIHVSLGMTTRDEEEKLIKLFEDNNRNKDLVIYSCTSGYPVPFEDVCLLEIERLKKSYGSEVKEIGFSGHHKGIAIDVAAYTLGATTIERHFTLDRTWKGTDHAASLEPDGLRRIVRDLDAVNKALNYKKEDMLDIEKIQREKLKYKNN